MKKIILSVAIICTAFSHANAQAKTKAPLPSFDTIYYQITNEGVPEHISNTTPDETNIVVSRGGYNIEAGYNTYYHSRVIRVYASNATYILNPSLVLTQIPSSPVMTDAEMKKNKLAVYHTLVKEFKF